MPQVDLAEDAHLERESRYSPNSLEARWQDSWHETRRFATPGQQDGRRPAYVFADCAVGDATIATLRSFAIADACARFLRARGRAVAFSLALDSFGQAAERQALLSHISPREWVQRHCEHLRAQLERLGCSCDWERVLLTSEEATYRWTQWLFLLLLEHDLVYRRGGRWLMRVEQYAEESERGLEALAGWDAAAIDSQRATMGRIEGVELQASVFGGDDLTVFTPHAEAIAKATFVAVSPAHAQVAEWASEPEFARRLDTMNELAAEPKNGEHERLPLAVSDALATVPGVAGMLPIVVSPLVDARFGATAVLGIPELDPTDRAIAQRLPKPVGAAWKTTGSQAAPRPAARYRMEDLAISRPGGWGAPIPLVHCPTCGTVPVPGEDLPVRLPEDLLATAEGEDPLAAHMDFRTCSCPHCGRPARRETDTIDPRLDRMWTWLAICVPPQRHTKAMDGQECARWLPAEQVVSSAGAAACLLERRMLARILQDLGELAPLADREPFAGALMSGSVRLDHTGDSERGSDAQELLTRAGADTVRLAMLYAAAPTRAFTWGEHQLRRCRRFLEELYGYAEPRLREWTSSRDQARIDTSDRLRRRLAQWCAVACEKITPALERLELQRATHNTMLLLTRISDFESRALATRGELDAHDRLAVVAALLVLVRLLEPLAPHIAEELWSLAGKATALSDAPWPTLARPARAQLDAVK